MTQTHAFDLHTHSRESDGTFSPAEVVYLARDAGLSLLALTDHDGMQGVPAAQATADECGLTLLPALEMDTEFSEELHILGLDVDPQDAALAAAIQAARARRSERNERILDRLAASGTDVRPWMQRGSGTITRMHIALALCDGGFAANPSDAFFRYLRPGCPGYATVARITPEEAIRVIRGAGGVPVLAHPCHLKGNAHRIVAALAEAGLMGVEAYYPTSTPKQTAQFCSLAAQHKLLVTCGSDFHGANRPQSPIGCAYTPSETLERTYRFFMERHQTR